MMTTWINPGPGTMICPVHGNVWLHKANPVMQAGITLSGNCEYEIRCGICGAKLTRGLTREDSAK
jgi:ferredoxin